VEIVIKLLIGFIAILHLYFLYIEMFAWETVGKKTFKTFPKELFTPTKNMAANQGLYNGFLAAGLIWTYFISSTEWAKNISLFFISCVVVAGIYGALTVSIKILYVQALPAIIVLSLLLFS